MNEDFFGISCPDYADDSDDIVAEYKWYWIDDTNGEPMILNGWYANYEELMVTYKEVSRSFVHCMYPTKRYRK